MSNKITDSQKLAKFFIDNNEKENIMESVFKFFRLDCLERSYINPAFLDEHIRKFEEQEKCDIEALTKIIDVVKQGQKGAINKENELIQKIVSYIDKNLFSDINITNIATKLNLSYYYICHIFKDKYGVSINTYINKKRLEHAMRKLVESGEKISDIATFCGFNNISYFTEIFSKYVGVSPGAFREKNKNVCFHKFFSFEDMLLATSLENIKLLDNNITDINSKFETILVHKPDQQFGFLHEAAIIEYHGVLYASWYNNIKNELQGYTPICGKRSYDGGKKWTDLEILYDDKSEKILYCPPVYGICDDKLYMFVNQMVSADHMHTLDLYVLNNTTDKFELLWSRSIPFKLNTNVVTLPNGKLMLPGRIAKLDGFPNTPAVLISDSGKIDADWRLVKIAENGDLPDGSKLIHPELSVILIEDTLYMFNRNDQRHVPLVYISKDFGEHWSEAIAHDIPYISSKIYAGNLLDGRKYLIANIDEMNRSKLAIYFTGKNNCFEKRLILFDNTTTKINNATACHYPAAYEFNGKLYIIATLNIESLGRGAVLFIIDLKET